MLLCAVLAGAGTGLCLQGGGLLGIVLLMGGLGGAAGLLLGRLYAGRPETVCPGCGRRVPGGQAVPTSSRGLYVCPYCGAALEE